MKEEIITELIRLTPQLLWILFAVILVVIFYKPIKYELLPRMKGFKALGLELTFVREELDKAIVKQEAKVSGDDRSQVLKRASRIVPVLQGAQILWVDDNPDNNTYECRILQSLGIFVDIACSSEEALSMLKQVKYDVVLSDMKRNGIEDEGIQFLSKMKKQNLYRRTIFYAGMFDESRGIPPYAFGMTNRPDHLLHYIMDALERER